LAKAVAESPPRRKMGVVETTPKSLGHPHLAWGWPNHPHGPPKARIKKKKKRLESGSGVAEPTPRPNGGSRATPRLAMGVA